MTTTAFPLAEIDLSDIEFWKRPWTERDAAFATLRREQPIAHFGDPVYAGPGIEIPPGPGYFALTKHRDVAEASRHPEVFRSGPGATSLLDLPPEMIEYFNGMISTDDPKHARLRRIVSNAFNPRTVRAIESAIDELAVTMVERAAREGTGDFITDIAAPFPLQIICDMMGVPPSEHATVLHHSNIILSNADPDFIPEGTDPIAAFLESGAGLTAIMEELGAYRREHPTDDITSALVNSTIENESLTQQELASFFVLLVAAGNETTRTAIAHGLLALTEHPDQRAILLADTEAILPTATEEMVRWASPVIWMRRTLAKDFDLPSGTLHEGDKVLLFYNSANRDEDVFDRADEFDVTRQPNNHFGFGAPGPHFCLGAHLARREISVMFRALLGRFPDARVTGTPEKLQSNFINGIKRLPYTL